MTDRYPIPEFLRRPVEAPRERPIIFSAPMVKALLAGTKTQTRRISKPHQTGGRRYFAGDGSPRLDVTCPYGQPGDRLYVRENAWQRPERTQKMMREGADTWPPFIYDADYAAEVSRENDAADLKAWGWKRRPSIHLPRIGSRIILEIVSVRVERLNDISEADALAEGVGVFHVDNGAGGSQFNIGKHWTDFADVAYRHLWESINGPGAWALNPFVWVLEFRRVRP